MHSYHALHHLADQHRATLAAEAELRRMAGRSRRRFARRSARTHGLPAPRDGLLPAC